MQTVGDILRAERERKGLTIKDVESAISIRALYLNAIEEGNYSIVPGEVYLKGFIRNYANYLGLNPQEVLEVYRQNKNPQANAAVPPQDDYLAEKPATAERESRSTNSSNKLVKWLALAIVTAGIVTGVAWWSSINKKPEQTPPPSANQQTPVSPQPTSPPLQPTIPAVPATKVVVTAKYSDNCWTQIIADGKEIFEGTPKKGDTHTWEAAKTLSAKFGNAGAVDIEYNGSSVGKIGGSGQVVVKNFTLTGITP